MVQTVHYKRLQYGFILISIIGSIITSFIIENRLAIRRDNNNILALTHRKIAKIFNYQQETEPLWFKAVNNTIIYILISLIVYNVFLFILGKDIMYKYFFGNI